MKNKFVLLAALFVCLCGKATDAPYATSAIPAELLVNSNVVKRMEDIRFEVISTGETILKKKYALTILNEAGDRHATWAEGYDKLQQVRSIDGSLFDASGKLIRKLKNKEVQDFSAISDISLFEDNRVKAHRFDHKIYPYTVEYEVEVKFNHTFYFEPWYPQESEMIAVEKSQLIVVSNSNYTVRHRSFNYQGSPAVTTDKGKTMMVWKVQNLPAIKRPFAAPVWRELTTCVVLAPTDFEIEGYKGNMSSWSDMGKFHFALNKGRDVLPEPIIQKVKELTAGITDEKEKVKTLYHYLQQNTRYISIQLGIGGWQPFDATFVAQKGYGDCKALSNYMFSLLKAVGIKSHYTIIRAGNSKEERNILEDFPSKQSNHIVLCVPMAKDTMWLECTSQSDPAGYMGGFTGNRKALIVDENGGLLVSTPKYGLKENQQVCTIKGTIDSSGNLTTTVRTLYKGMQQDNRHQMLTYLSKDKVKDHLNEELSFPTYEIVDFKYQQKKDVLPQIDEELKLFVSRFATLSGKRLFISPNLLNRNESKFTLDEKRKHDFVFENEYAYIDSVELELPAGYEPEAMPQAVKLQTKFGTYSSSVQLVNNKLIYRRIREQFSGRFPASDQAELAKFYAAIYKADRNRVVLVRKEN